VRAYSGFFNGEWEKRDTARATMGGLIDNYKIGALTLRAALQYSKIDEGGAAYAGQIAQIRTLATALDRLGHRKLQDRPAVSLK
jgi:hypothetical protein